MGWVSPPLPFGGTCGEGTAWGTQPGTGRTCRMRVESAADAWLKCRQSAVTAATAASTGIAAIDSPVVVICRYNITNG